LRSATKFDRQKKKVAVPALFRLPPLYRLSFELKLRQKWECWWQRGLSPIRDRHTLGQWFAKRREPDRLVQAN